MKSANPRHWDFYKRFRVRMNDYSNQPKNVGHGAREILLLGPDLLHLAICLVGDRDIPWSFKVKLGAAITYFISPVDFLPELLLGPLGYIDDIAILAWVINNMLNQIDQNIILRYWAGDASVLSSVQKIVNATDRLLGKGLLRRIKSTFTKSHHD